MLNASVCFGAYHNSVEHKHWIKWFFYTINDPQIQDSDPSSCSHATPHFSKALPKHSTVWWKGELQECSDWCQILVNLIFIQKWCNKLQEELFYLKWFTQLGHSIPSSALFSWSIAALLLHPSIIFSLLPPSSHQSLPYAIKVWVCLDKQCGNTDRCNIKPKGDKLSQLNHKMQLKEEW